MSQLVGGTLKTSAERLEDNIVEITVTVDADDVKKSVASTYKDIANKYKFPGFRPGHAPRKVIDNNVGKQAVLSEATESLVNEVLPLVLEKEDLVPVTDPMYPRPAMVEDAKDFEFKVRFGVRPELTLTSCDPVAIKLPSEEATEAEIDSQIETFRGYFGKYQDIEGRSIEAGDSVYIKCKGGENAESIDFENRLYKLGSGHMPATFDEGLIGLNPGDSKTITFALPVEEPKEGEEAEEPKNAVVDVTVNRLVERVLPELTDEFAKNNFGFDDIAAMREAISKEIGEQKKQAIPQIKENRVTGKLAERLEGEPSRPYLATIYQELGQNFMNQLQARGMTFDTWLAMNNITAEQFGNDLERQATDIAKESLALDALVREKGFECTDEDLDEEFKKSGIEDWEAAKKQFLEDGRMPAVRVSVRRNKAIDWLLETAEVTVSDEPDVPAEEPKKEAKEEKPAKKRSSKKAAEKEAAAEEEAKEEKPAKKRSSKKAEAKEEAPEAEEKPKKKTSRKTTTEAAD